MALGYLALHRLDDAIVDFNAALEINSKLASSLYGRGLAKLKKGDRVGAHADMAAAKAIQADIGEKLARYSISRLSQCCFELCKGLFDRVQVGAIGWQIARLRAGPRDRLPDAGDFMGW
jgi:hypothetical protein